MGLATRGAVYGLQWGHRLSAMEMPLWGDEFTPKGRLQWGHRLSAMEIPEPYACAGII